MDEEPRPAAEPPQVGPSDEAPQPAAGDPTEAATPAAPPDPAAPDDQASNDQASDEADPPEAPRRRRRWPWLAAAAVLVVVVVAGGGVLFLRSRSGPSYPSAWDPRLNDIVAFDQQARGLDFKHPVAVDYLDDEQFNKTVTTEDDDLKPADRKELEASEATLRALGLLTGPTSLLDQVNTLQSSAVLAFYSPKTKRVTVRGTDLTPAVRVTLAHELTHALQDQHFGLEHPPKGLTTAQQGTRKAIIEGDARYIENKYAAQMTADDRASYLADEQKAASAVTADSSIPPFLLAEEQVPYVLGEGLVTALRARNGNNPIDPLFKDPPASDAQLSDLLVYNAKTAPLKVATPTLGPGETKLRDNVLGGSLDWYFLTATRNDVHDALWLAQAWGGDASVTYRDADGRNCVKAEYVPANGTDKARAQAVLNTWAAAGDPGAATVAATTDGVELVSCDPGTPPSAQTKDQSMDALQLLSFRLGLEAGLPAATPDATVRCLADFIQGRINLADFSRPTAEVETEITNAAKDARLTCPS